MDYTKEFSDLSALEARRRGNEFEALINKIFHEANVLIYSRFRTSNNSQEIDGAIMIFSKVFLLEAKYENDETLAASKLYSFLGKINSKIEGTLGFFISYNELKENFVDAIRGGLRQNCILIHGPSNIKDIISGKVDVKGYLEYCYIQASTKNRAHVSTSEFLTKGPLIANPATPAVVAINEWIDIFNALTGKSVDLAAFTAGITGRNFVGLEIGKRIVDVYSTLVLDKLTQEKLVKLFELLLENDRQGFTNAIIDKLKGSYWHELADDFFTTQLRGKLTIQQGDRTGIIDNVTQVLGLSHFESENEAARAIDIFYGELTTAEKNDLANRFLDIYLDTIRKADKPQKQFAEKIFNDIKSNSGGSYFAIIRDEIAQKIKLYKLEEYLYKDDSDDEKSMQKFTRDRFIQKYSKVFKENQFKIEALYKFFDEEYNK